MPDAAIFVWTIFGKAEFLFLSAPRSMLAMGIPFFALNISAAREKLAFPPVDDLLALELPL
jgi:hypothetical protein